MSFNKEQFREAIARVCTSIGHHSYDSQELLMLTAAQESQLGTYITQFPGGPARGVFQMEMSTHDDLWENFLVRHKVLSDRLLKLRSGMGVVWDMQYNLAYQIAMARVQYRRFKEPLPKFTDYNRDLYTYITAVAQYWKTYYNTEAGKGSVMEAVANYGGYCK